MTKKKAHSGGLVFLTSAVHYAIPICPLGFFSDLEQTMPTILANRRSMLGKNKTSWLLYGHPVAVSLLWLVLVFYFLFEVAFYENGQPYYPRLFRLTENRLFFYHIKLFAQTPQTNTKFLVPVPTTTQPWINRKTSLGPSVRRDLGEV